MLISLLALLAIAVASLIRWLLANVPINIEGPETLELALIGIGVIAVYAVATRRIGRRPARNIRWDKPIAKLPQTTVTTSELPTNEPKRGAA